MLLHLFCHAYALTCIITSSPMGRYVMKKILVSGLVNIETSLNVDSFPINYSPIEYPFFGVNSVVSGVGFNVAKALQTLGSSVDLLTEVGDDLNGEIIKNQIGRVGLSLDNVITYQQSKSAESVVLVDSLGNRKIYCDLKDIQERNPIDPSKVNFKNYSLVALTNINFNRELLKVAKEKGIKIATDVHVLSDINDEYNKDFMANADILFLSNESIKDREADFMKEIYHKYHNEIIVCGCGNEGALLYLGKEDKFLYEPAVAPKGVVSTLGAGDALFASFIHFVNKKYSIPKCLKLAVLFAGLKISVPGGSNGFVSEDELFEFIK